MDQLDLDISAILSALALIVNRAGRSEKGAAEAVPICKVPTALLQQAKAALQRFDGTEYGTDQIKHAVERTFD